MYSSAVLELCCLFINSNLVCIINSISYSVLQNLWNVAFSGLLGRSCSSGLIGILPDSTAGLLRFKCVLTLIVVLMMVSALKPD